jgi:hypothetical protein
LEGVEKNKVEGEEDGKRERGMGLRMEEKEREGRKDEEIEREVNKDKGRKSEREGVKTRDR